MANLVSHGHVRHFGWHVFAVVEYCHDATVETLDAATVLLQSHTHTHTHTHTVDVPTTGLVSHYNALVLGLNWTRSRLKAKDLILYAN